MNCLQEMLIYHRRPKTEPWGQGEWIYPVHFLPPSLRETYFLISWLLSCMPNTLKKASSLKVKTIFHGSKFFPLRVNPYCQGRQKHLWKLPLSKYIHSPYFISAAQADLSLRKSYSSGDRFYTYVYVSYNQIHG